MIISGPDNEILPLRRLVSHLPYVPACLDDPVIQCDASPWGAGTTLRVQGRIVEFWMVPWRTKDVVHLSVVTGVSKHMTFWETVATLLCLIIWDSFAKKKVLILGDNTGSLHTQLI